MLIWDGGPCKGREGPQPLGGERERASFTRPALRVKVILRPRDREVEPAESQATLTSQEEQT